MYTWLKATDADRKVQQTAEGDVDDEKMSSVGISSFPLNFHLVLSNCFILSSST